MTATISARGLTKRFGRTIALDHLDLEALPGQITAVLGPNGAGKTTFVRAVATLLRLDGGELRIAGMDVVDDAARVRARIGLAGQTAAVEPAMTGRENLRMVARLYGQTRRDARRNADDLLERLGLSDAADRRVRTYSGGMRSRMELWDIVRELVAGGTDVLLTTQYLDEADALAERIVIIDHGRAIASGTPTQLKRQIGGTVLDLQVHDTALLHRVASQLAPAVRNAVRTDEATRRLTVRADNGVAELVRALHAIDDPDIVDAFELRQPTLDEVFLALTGRTGAEGAGRPATAG